MYREQSYYIRKELHKLGDLQLESGFYVAGGAVTSVFTNTPINDLDLYFETETDYNNFRRKLLDKNYESKFETDSAVSYVINGTRVQLIKKLFGAPLDVIGQFDFTICMGAYLPGKDVFILDDTFLLHCSRRQLCFNTYAKYPICSLWRVKKFMKKGYHLPGSEIIKLGLSINNLNLKNFRDLREQLQGIDTAIFMSLTEALLEKKDEEYDFRTALAFIDNYLNERLFEEE